jgi:hypothetical protein
MKGIEATDRALQLNPNFADALTYKNILLRMQANMETDMGKRAQLIKQADEIQAKALALRAQAAGTAPAK